MSYAKLYFGKEMNEVSYNDIESYFIDEKEESDKIEYKSFKSETTRDKVNYDSLLESICGMLNSEGGLIIWGAPLGIKHSSDNKRKIFKGALTTFSFAFEKDSFINKVTDSISPAPTGINIMPIEKEGKFVHIISIEKSMYSPHQYDYAYYMRLDGQTRKAPHHYVEAMMKKITFPVLSGKVLVGEPKVDFDAKNMWVDFSIEFIVDNLSKFQNEEDLICNFRIYGAQLRGLSDSRFDDDYNMKNSVTQEKDYNPAQNVLHFGNPFVERIHAVQHGIIARTHQSDFQIYFQFGGKKSPLKVSLYEFELSVNTGKATITQKFEKVDKYLYELQDEHIEIALSEKKD